VLLLEAGRRADLTCCERPLWNEEPPYSPSTKWATNGANACAGSPHGPDTIVTDGPGISRWSPPRQLDLLRLTKICCESQGKSLVPPATAERGRARGCIRPWALLAGSGCWRYFRWPRCRRGLDGRLEEQRLTPPARAFCEPTDRRGRGAAVTGDLLALVDGIRGARTSDAGPADASPSYHSGPGGRGSRHGCSLPRPRAPRRRTGHRPLQQSCSGVCTNASAQDPSPRCSTLGRISRCRVRRPAPVTAAPPL